VKQALALLLFEPPPPTRAHAPAAPCFLELFTSEAATLSARRPASWKSSTATSPIHKPI